MEGKDLNTSPIKEFPFKSSPTTREPKCNRCRNHDLISRMKGHQGHCPYTQCVCRKCVMLAERRRVSRQKIRLRREEDIDFQRFLQSANRTSPLDQQTNLSTNVLNVSEPNTMWSRTSWPMDLSLAPPTNVSVPLPCDLNSQTPMVSESPYANIYSPNKLADFFPPYAHTSPSGYPPAHMQNPSYKSFNSDPSTMYGRSCFNTVSYNRTPVAQQMTNHRFGICQGSHYVFNWPSKETTYIPTNLSDECPTETCSLVNETRK